MDLPITLPEDYFQKNITGMVTDPQGMDEYCAALDKGIKFAHHKTHWLYYIPGDKCIIINTKTGNRLEFVPDNPVDWTGCCMLKMGKV